MVEADPTMPSGWNPASAGRTTGCDSAGFDRVSAPWSARQKMNTGTDRAAEGTGEPQGPRAPARLNNGAGFFMPEFLDYAFTKRAARAF